MIMSLRDGDLPSKQSPVSRGGCFAQYARNGMVAKVNAFPLTAKRFGDDVRELQSQSQEELDALLPSILDKAFKGEL